MGIIASKSGKLSKAAAIGILLMMSFIATIQVDSGPRKKMSAITCDGDEPETIIVPHDRLRTRMLVDIFKKLTFLPSPLRHVALVVRDVKLNSMKLLFVNAYQRNVFYVFAFSTVP